MPWGRSIEDAIRQTAYSSNALSDATHSDNRSSAGQAGALQREVLELQSRSTQVVNIGTLTTSVTLPANFDLVVSTNSRTITFAPPLDGFPRKALVFISGIAVNYDPLNVSGTGSTGEVKVRVNGIVSAPMAAPVFTSTPPGYVQSFYLTAVLPGSSSFDLEVFVVAGQATTPTARTFNVGVTDCVATVVYQERV